MLQCQHCTHFTIFFPIINLFLSQPYMIHPLRQVQHTYRDYAGMKAELGRKSESSRDVDLAFQNLLSEATTDTLPNTPNPKWRCQVYWQSDSQLLQFSAQQSWTKAVIFPQHVQIWNLWQHMSTSDIPVHRAVRAGNWDRDHFTGEIQPVRTSGTASHSQSCVWQLYPEGLCTETQLSSPMMTPFPLFFWNRSAWSLILTIQLPETMEAHKVPRNSCQKCLINQRTKTSTVGISMQGCLDGPVWKHGESLKKAFFHCLWKPVVYG